MVLSLLQPFIKREAEKDTGNKNKRPLININVGVADGRQAPAVAARVIEHEDD